MHISPNELFEKWFEEEGTKREKSIAQTDEMYLKECANFAFLEGFFAAKEEDLKRMRTDENI